MTKTGESIIRGAKEALAMTMEPGPKNTKGWEESCQGLKLFIKESNKIEGITRKVLKRELQAHNELLAVPHLMTQDIERFVMLIQPGARLRCLPGDNVRVGSHIPLPGGPLIERLLAELLIEINDGLAPYEAHLRYETLHPFTDGNGRSGRAIWLWQRAIKAQLTYPVPSIGFLHTWYYGSLQHIRNPLIRGILHKG